MVKQILKPYGLAKLSSGIANKPSTIKWRLQYLHDEQKKIGGKYWEDPYWKQLDAEINELRVALHTHGELG